MKCFYGCGRDASFAPHKGTPHWCCESHWSRCPENRNKNSKSKMGKQAWNKNRKQPDDEKAKQSKSMKNKWTNSEYRNKQTISRSSSKYKQHMRNIRRGVKNPMYGKNITDDHKIILSLNKEKIKIRYPKFYSVEKIRENNGKIEVVCKYCDQWFRSSTKQLYERIRQIESSDGNMKNFLYCCDKHKFLCPYSNRVDPKTLKEYEIYKRKVMNQTNKSLKNNHLKNIEKRSFDFHLDHKFSIVEGFKNNIDPMIIGHIKNLEMISAQKNTKKSRKCSISLIELLKEIG